MAAPTEVAGAVEAAPAGRIGVAGAGLAAAGPAVAAEVAAATGLVGIGHTGPIAAAEIVRVGPLAQSVVVLVPASSCSPQRIPRQNIGGSNNGASLRVACACPYSRRPGTCCPAPSTIKPYPEDPTIFCECPDIAERFAVWGRNRPDIGRCRHSLHWQPLSSRFKSPGQKSISRAKQETRRVPPPTCLPCTD